MFCSDTFEKQLTGIGTLFTDSDVVESHFSGGDSHNFKVQRLVSTSFITCDPRPNINHGPFSTAREWLSVRLDIAEIDCRQRLAQISHTDTQNNKSDKPADEKSCTYDGELDVEQRGNREVQTVSDGGKDHNEQGKGDQCKDEVMDTDEGDENEKTAAEEEKPENKAEEADDDDFKENPEDLENTLKIISKLRDQLDNFFPNTQLEPEPTMIFHYDLNQHNILINENGSLDAVVDWECVSFMPLSIACQYPSFLEGKPNSTKPIKDQWQDEDGELPELYWENLEYYELTKLRSFFLEEMRILQPGWVEVFESSQRQRDFVFAVEASDDPFMFRRILSWLKDLELGA